MYKLLIRPLFFLLTLKNTLFHFSLVRLTSKIQVFRLFIVHYIWLMKTIGNRSFGLKFKNPVGLAAGFDKDASCTRSQFWFWFYFK
jgi:dihydroorotate dehydrogenase